MIIARSVTIGIIASLGMASCGKVGQPVPESRPPGYSTPQTPEGLPGSVSNKSSAAGNLETKKSVSKLKLSNLAAVGRRGCLVADGILRCWVQSDIDSATAYLLPVPAGMGEIRRIYSTRSLFCGDTISGVRCWGYSRDYKLPEAAGWQLFEITVPSTIGTIWALDANDKVMCIATDREFVCWSRNGRNYETIVSYQHYEATDWANRVVSVSISNLGTICKVLEDGRFNCPLTPANGFSESERLQERRISLVSVSSLFACLSDSQGVTCWGSNGAGQTSGARDLKVSPSAFLVTSEVGACSIAKKDNSLQCWGQQTNTRDEIDFSQLHRVYSVALSDYFGCSLSDEGLTCWGMMPTHPTVMP